MTNEPMHTPRPASNLPNFGSNEQTLVERLRQRGFYNNQQADEMCHQAADQLERLESDVAVCHVAIDSRDSEIQSLKERLRLADIVIEKVRGCYGKMSPLHFSIEAYDAATKGDA